MLMTMFHVSVSRVIAYSIFLATSLVLAMMGRVHGFPQIDPSLPRRCRSQPPLLGFFQRPPCCCTRNVQLIRIFNAYNNFDESIGQERDDEDDDEYLNVDMLGDWRAFRHRNSLPVVRVKKTKLYLKPSAKILPGNMSPKCGLTQLQW